MREERAALRRADGAANRRAGAARAVGAVSARRRERSGARPKVVQPLTRRAVRRLELPREKRQLERLQTGGAQEGRVREEGRAWQG